MTVYMKTERRANSLAVQVWRHKLMHTSSPRELCDHESGVTFRWLLHWGDDHLPREHHFKFQPGGSILNLSLFGLIDDVRRAAEGYLDELPGNAGLEQSYDTVNLELDTYEFRPV